MQFQADLLGLPVEVAAERETTALGAAALAAGRDARSPSGRSTSRALRRRGRDRCAAGLAGALNRSRT